MVLCRQSTKYNPPIFQENSFVFIVELGCQDKNNKYHLSDDISCNFVFVQKGLKVLKFKGAKV